MSTITFQDRFSVASGIRSSAPGASNNNGPPLHNASSPKPNHEQGSKAEAAKGQIVKPDNSNSTHNQPSTQNEQQSQMMTGAKEPPAKGNTSQPAMQAHMSKSERKKANKEARKAQKTQGEQPGNTNSKDNPSQNVQAGVAEHKNNETAQPPSQRLRFVGETTWQPKPDETARDSKVLGPRPDPSQHKRSGPNDFVEPSASRQLEKAAADTNDTLTSRRNQTIPQRAFVRESRIRPAEVLQQAPIRFERRPVYVTGVGMVGNTKAFIRRRVSDANAPPPKPTAPVPAVNVSDILSWKNVLGAFTPNTSRRLSLAPPPYVSPYQKAPDNTYGPSFDAPECYPVRPPSPPSRSLFPPLPPPPLQSARQFPTRPQDFEENTYPAFHNDYQSLTQLQRELDLFKARENELDAQKADLERERERLSRLPAIDATANTAVENEIYILKAQLQALQAEHDRIALKAEEAQVVSSQRLSQQETLEARLTQLDDIAETLRAQQSSCPKDQTPEQRHKLEDHELELAKEISELKDEAFKQLRKLEDERRLELDKHEEEHRREVLKAEEAGRKQLEQAEKKHKESLEKREKEHQDELRKLEEDRKKEFSKYKKDVQMMFDALAQKIDMSAQRKGHNGFSEKPSMGRVKEWVSTTHSDKVFSKFSEQASRVSENQPFPVVSSHDHHSQEPSRISKASKDSRCSVRSERELQPDTTTDHRHRKTRSWAQGSNAGSRGGKSNLTAKEMYAAARAKSYRREQNSKGQDHTGSEIGSPGEGRGSDYTQWKTAVRTSPPPESQIWRSDQSSLYPHDSGSQVLLSGRRSSRPNKNAYDEVQTTRAATKESTGDNSRKDGIKLDRTLGASREPVAPERDRTATQVQLFGRWPRNRKRGKDEDEAASIRSPGLSPNSSRLAPSAWDRSHAKLPHYRHVASYHVDTGKTPAEATPTARSKQAVSAAGLDKQASAPPRSSSQPAKPKRDPSPQVESKDARARATKRDSPIRTKSRPSSHLSNAVKRNRDANYASASTESWVTDHSERGELEDSSTRGDRRSSAPRSAAKHDSQNASPRSGRAEPTSHTRGNW